MKKFRMIILLYMFGCFISSCENNTKECVKALMNEGISYEAAVYSCENAAAESQIR